MKKKQLIILILLALVLIVIPNNANAKEVDNVFTYNTINNTELLNANSATIVTKQLANTTKCTGDDSVLGSYNDPNSVASLLQEIFNYTKIIGPFIVLVMSGIDFIKIIVTGDEEGMKKAQSKLIIRLILAGSLFFLPDLVSVVLEMFNITSSGICGLQ